MSFLKILTPSEELKRKFRDQVTDASNRLNSPEGQKQMMDMAIGYAGGVKPVGKLSVNMLKASAINDTNKILSTKIINMRKSGVAKQAIDKIVQVYKKNQSDMFKLRGGK